MAGPPIADGPKLHSSVPSHLSTELEILRALIERSKFQHRHQPFLQRMREVLRLGTRVQAIIPDETSKEAISISNQGTKQLLIKFIQALLKATVSTQQIIQLEHFLPTQISLLAVYGRLFALGTSIAAHHSLDLEQVLEGRLRVETSKRKKAVDMDMNMEMGEILREVKMDIDIDTDSNLVPQAGVHEFDFGQKIERVVDMESRAKVSSPPPMPTLTPKDKEDASFNTKHLSPQTVDRSSSPKSSPPAVSSPDEPIQQYVPPPPSSRKKRIESTGEPGGAAIPAVAADATATTTTKSTGKKRAASEAQAKPKKKKRDDMDSIFGF